jgi:hypothetical protein
MFFVPENAQELFRDAVVHVLVLQQLRDHPDRAKTLVSDRIPTARVEDARTDDCGEVLEGPSCSQ